MANTKSAKKQARKNTVRRQINLARKTDVKTAIKKVLLSLEAGASAEEVRALLKEAESKMARAKGKIFHKKTVSRKVSRLNKRVASVHGK